MQGLGGITHHHDMAPLSLISHHPLHRGTMALADYLRTRNLEVVVHGLDLAKALGLDWTPPRDSAADAFALLGEIAVDRGVANNVLPALTGREGADVAPVLT